MFAEGIAAALPELRAAAESNMHDTFTAYAPSWVDEDGIKTEALTAQYVTKGKVQGLGGLRGGDPQGRTDNVGGVERPVMASGLHLPLSAPAPSRGWVYECTEAGPLSDPSLVGRRYRVVEGPAKSLATARRLDVVEV